MARPTQRDYEFRLDNEMVFYLSRRSVTSFELIAGHFELHPETDLHASLTRLTEAKRVVFDPRRDGWSTCAAPAKSSTVGELNAKLVASAERTPEGYDFSCPQCSLPLKVDQKNLVGADALDYRRSRAALGVRDDEPLLAAVTRLRAGTSTERGSPNEQTTTVRDDR